MLGAFSEKDKADMVQRMIDASIKENTINTVAPDTVVDIGQGNRN